MDIKGDGRTVMLVQTRSRPRGIRRDIGCPWLFLATIPSVGKLAENLTGLDINNLQ